MLYYLCTYQLNNAGIHIIRVADPVDADPDPTSENNRVRIQPKKNGSGSGLLKFTLIIFFHIRVNTIKILYYNFGQNIFKNVQEVVTYFV